MRKYNLILVLLLSLQVSNANEPEPQPEFICSAATILQYKGSIDSLSNDKRKHCTMSCLLARRCSMFQSFSVGVVKELADLMGMGNPEWADMRANMRGIMYGKFRIRSCYRLCEKAY